MRNETATSTDLDGSGSVETVSYTPSDRSTRHTCMTASEQSGLIANVSSKVIAALPGQMLLMLLLNVAFILALFYLLIHQNASRERILGPLLEACSKTIPLEALPHILPGDKP
jgi:hypothetical protein